MIFSLRHAPLKIMAHFAFISFREKASINRNLEDERRLLMSVILLLTGHGLTAVSENFFPSSEPENKVTV